MTGHLPLSRAFESVVSAHRDVLPGHAPPKMPGSPGNPGHKGPVYGSGSERPDISVISHPSANLATVLLW